MSPKISFALGEKRNQAKKKKKPTGILFTDIIMISFMHVSPSPGAHFVSLCISEYLARERFP